MEECVETKQRWERAEIRRTASQRYLDKLKAEHQQVVEQAGPDGLYGETRFQKRQRLKREAERRRTRQRQQGYQQELEMFMLQRKEVMLMLQQEQEMLMLQQQDHQQQGHQQQGHQQQGHQQQGCQQQGHQQQGCQQEQEMLMLQQEEETLMLQQEEETLMLQQQAQQPQQAQQAQEVQQPQQAQQAQQAQQTPDGLIPIEQVEVHPATNRKDEKERRRAYQAKYMNKIRAEHERMVEQAQAGDVDGDGPLEEETRLQRKHRLDRERKRETYYKKKKEEYTDVHGRGRD